MIAVGALALLTSHEGKKTRNSGTTPRRALARGFEWKFKPLASAGRPSLPGLRGPSRAEHCRGLLWGKRIGESEVRM
jgi:hypothetical protein